MNLTELPGAVQFAMVALSILGGIGLVWVLLDLIMSISRLITARAKLLEAEAKWYAFKHGESDSGE